MRIINTLTIYVYDFPLGDCTNDGISKYYKTLRLYCPDGPDSFDADVEIPINFCMVEQRQVYAGEIYCDIVPATIMEGFGLPTPRPGWWMSGGNIGYSCDSRFDEMAGVSYPLKIHDRRE